MEWAGTKISAQEVTGLNFTTETIDYRAGDDQTFIKQKVPGLKSFENISIKKGMFKDDLDFYEWFTDVQANPERRETITIQLLDETHAPVMVWTVENAYPIKLSGPTLNGENNALAIETLELAHEGITLETA
ncbi:MAG: hypothetical protein OHK0053_12060 [Microscillaceae bacterium]